jgi:hypothetical protein
VFINLNQGWIVIFYENMNKVDKKVLYFYFTNFVQTCGLIYFGCRMSLTALAQKKYSAV